jgi:hypothetical protein
VVTNVEQDRLRSWSPYHSRSAQPVPEIPAHRQQDRRNLVSNRAEFERETAEDFWEVAASGRRFSREYVWAVLKERYESSDTDGFEVEGWELRDFQLREIAPTVYC